MNKPIKKLTPPWQSIGEQLLAAAAVKIELPPSQHALLAERKATIEKHLERDGSPLKGRIRMFYQQGSVAIGATIRAKFRFEGFDIDIIVELLANGMTPCEVLDTLYEAVRGDEGSRYYEMTTRQSRCVTVTYADGMHIDLSPSVLLDENDPRRSNIFHSKLEEPRSRDTTILTNSYAFVQEYMDRCPVDQAFQEDYALIVAAADTGWQRTMADAETLPVPEHSTVVGGKSAVTVALQLLKRNRNIRWSTRHRRMPASVMFSCLTLEVAAPGRTIGENLRVIATYILDRLLSAKGQGRLIHVENPRCPGDVFTDRWPENQSAQDLLIGDLKLFLEQLRILLDQSSSLATKVKVLKEMFGENVGQAVVDSMGDELGGLIQSGNHQFGATGTVLAAPVSTPGKLRVPASTFYGTRWER
ncbi:nucleotidyltransferase domain-containing protein [Gymnodinialimonas sp.]